ncbi:hypothetical protein [Candidatus Venteria ishoeyi]|nr:hypothetical protein [Candidatus Venteria ishoeyi]
MAIAMKDMAGFIADFGYKVITGDIPFEALGVVIGEMFDILLDE